MNHLYPILPIEAARAHEAAILGDDPGRTEAAMLNAGKAIGLALCQDYREIGEWPENPSILLLAGKGLNTGDALVACKTLRADAAGLRVTMVASAGVEELHPFARTALEHLQEAIGDDLRVVSIEGYLKQPGADPDVVLDGLYGLGFRPPLEPGIAALLRAVNQRPGIGLRASIDLPSGVGDSADPDSFVADFTYIPGVAKAPCFLAAHAPFVGRIRFLEVAPFTNQPAADEQKWFVAAPDAFKDLNRLRPAGSDKRSFGHCLILAGSVHMPGAALMAGMAALQSGAGLLTTLTPASVCSHLAGALPESMWRPLPLSHDGGLDVETVRIVAHLAQRAQALLIGPGLLMDRSTVFSLCRIVRENALPLVIDASALTQDVIAAVLGRPLSAGPVILTPHRGEYARLLGMKEDPRDAEGLLAFSAKYRVTTVLKGSPTILSDGRRLISVPTGGPVLARGGSGDILSGMLLAQLAQHPGDPLQAALIATTWHGAAADSLARQCGATPVRTSELLPHLSVSLRS
jgi:ADP-dependent NAD(P)H-hydrate dehydratase / NAD(P)H-hydrate epimerase